MKYKSEALRAIHEGALADFEVGAISDARMGEYDEMCLVQESKQTHESINPAPAEQLSHATA